MFLVLSVLPFWWYKKISHYSSLHFPVIVSCFHIFSPQDCLFVNFFNIQLVCFLVSIRNNTLTNLNISPMAICFVIFFNIYHLLIYFAFSIFAMYLYYLYCVFQLNKDISLFSCMNFIFNIKIYVCDSYFYFLLGEWPIIPFY